MVVSGNQISVGEGVLEEVNKEGPAISKRGGIFVAQANSPLKFVGWCFDDKKGLSLPSKVITLLVIEYATQKEYRLEARRFKRPDVSVNYGNRALETCGFNCEALPKALPPGLYLVEAIQHMARGEVRTVLGNGLLALL